MRLFSFTGTSDRQAVLFSRGRRGCDERSSDAFRSEPFTGQCSSDMPCTLHGLGCASQASKSMLQVTCDVLASPVLPCMTGVPYAQAPRAAVAWSLCAISRCVPTVERVRPPIPAMSRKRLFQVPSACPHKWQAPFEGADCPVHARMPHWCWHCQSTMMIIAASFRRGTSASLKKRQLQTKLSAHPRGRRQVGVCVYSAERSAEPLSCSSSGVNKERVTSCIHMLLFFLSWQIRSPWPPKALKFGARICCRRHVLPEGRARGHRRFLPRQENVLARVIS